MKWIVGHVMLPTEPGSHGRGRNDSVSFLADKILIFGEFPVTFSVRCLLGKKQWQGNHPDGTIGGIGVGNTFLSAPAVNCGMPFGIAQNRGLLPVRQIDS
ncbi:MAG: hypothetical protein GXO78_12235 [Calditrichaeota bacterium]|nr:hypothetical protein [Calditrichota bacterium]